MDTQIEQVDDNQPNPNEDQPELTAEGNETSQPAGEADAIQIPDCWEAPIKDFINSIKDQAGKKAVFDKISNFEKGYQTKFQELASQRKQMDEDRSFLDTYRNFEKGIDPQMKNEILARYSNIPNYMNSLHQMDLIASRDPMKFIQTFCANNQITADQINGILSDKNYQAMQTARSNDALKAEIIKDIQEQQQKQREQEEINRFVSETNPDGTSKHPLLADREFVEDMDKLKTAFPNKSLEDVYQMALSFRPDLRQKEVQAEAARIEAAKEAQKAKSVIGVKPNTPVVDATERKGWEQVLNEQLNPFV